MLEITDKKRAMGVPEWSPASSDELTLDLLIREFGRIAFDDEQPAGVRLKAMEGLAKHAGMFIERVELSTPDMRRRAALESMFDSMSSDEKRRWLAENTGSSGSGLGELLSGGDGSRRDTVGLLNRANPVGEPVGGGVGRELEMPARAVVGVDLGYDESELSRLGDDDDAPAVPSVPEPAEPPTSSPARERDRRSGNPFGRHSAPDFFRLLGY